MVIDTNTQSLGRLYASVTWLSLVEVMVCRQSGAKPLPQPVTKYCQLVNWKQTFVKFDKSVNVSLQENAFQMSAMLFRVQYVNKTRHFQHTSGT